MGARISDKGRIVVMRKKIYYRFAVYSVLCLMVLALALLIIGGYYSAHYAHEGIIRNMELTGQRVVTQMGERHLYKSQYLVEGVAEIAFSLIDRGQTDREVIESMLYGLVRSHPDITGIGIAFSPNGFDSADYLYRGAPNCDEAGALSSLLHA